jgi:hypothetical protein
MPNYANGKIYVIRSNQTDDVYIGSTIQPLSSRMTVHRSHYRGIAKGIPTCMSSVQLLQHGDAYIELIENCPCNNKEALLKREGEIMRQHPNRVNKRLEGRTPKEYKEDHKDFYTEYHKNYHKQYVEDNKEKIKDYHKTYHNNNKEKYNEKNKGHYESNKEHYKQKSREYHHANKEAIAIRSQTYRDGRKDITAIKSKEYREKNKVALNAMKARRVVCECGKEVCKGALTRHKRTVQHREYEQRRPD